MPRLVVEKGSDKGKHVEIPARGTAIIGRDANAGFRLGDTMASRLHFRIESREDGVWLCDLKSMNGTYLNGERVAEARLKPGDRVQVGETLFTFLEDAEAQSQDSFVNRVMAGYRVLERVGRGGMGTVYKAEQITLKRIVALKVIASEHTRNRSYMEQFLREARAAAQLNHPNIVQVYDAKAVEDSWFYSMEFMPNGSVQDLLSKEKSLSPERGLRMALDAARGLEYAERKQIVHRDIKPDNLMIGELGVIKIGDLGLAQSLGEASELDDGKTVLGTPHFIAPEQVQGRPADHRSDIYALGATLYRMLAGATPYSGANVREIVQRKVKEDPVPLHDVDPQIPESLDALVRKMMARDPAQRFQTVAETVAAMEAALASPGPTESAAAPRRPLALWIGAAAAALVAVALFAFRGGGGANGAGTGGNVPVATTTADAGPSAAEEDLAREYFRGAQEYESRQLHRDRESSIREAIALYERIPQKCPRSSLTGKAAERVAALQGLLGEAAAVKTLHDQERADGDAFRRLVQASRAGQLDAGVLRAAAAESDRRYAAVEQAHPKSDAAKRARQLRDQVKQWEGRAEAALGRVAQTDAAARKELDGSRFGAARDLWQGLAKECQDQAPRSPYEDGRYGDLLLGPVLDARLRDVQAAAEASFARVQQEAGILAGQEKFDDAKARWRWAADTFGVPELTQRAQQEIAGIDRRILDKIDRERKAADERERQRIAEDERRLAQAVQATQEPLKRYAFRKAADALKAGTSGLQIEKNLQSAALRLQDLESMARFKAEFIRRASGPENPREFRRDIKTKTEAGQISGAAEDTLTIAVVVEVGRDKGRAEIPHRWTEFPPRDFCAVLAKRWSFGAADWLGYGCICQEYGLDDDAADAFKQAQAKAGGDAAVRDAATRHLGRPHGAAGDGGGASPEADADRRWKHAKALVDQRKYADAKTELDALLRDGADTEFVRRNRADIDALAKDIAPKAEAEEKQGRRTQLLQKVQDSMAGELKEAKNRRADVRDHIKAMADDADRAFQGALVTLSWQEWKDAAALWDELRAAVEPKIDGYVARGQQEFVGWVYYMTIRALILAGDRVRGDRLHREAVVRLDRVDAWRNWMAKDVGAWKDQQLPAAVPEVKRLRAEVDADPTDPDRIWRLCLQLQRDVPLRLDERQYLRCLLEVFPDHPRVLDGEAMYHLAENYLAFREVSTARDLYAQLKAEHPDHPRVKDPNGGASVERRLRECDDLLVRLGYRK